jgi:outer membrane receptor protein involved in Fe transport
LGALLFQGTLLQSVHGAAAAADKVSGNEDISEVVVTGSLIPQNTRLEAPTPITVITTADIEARGFSNLTEALQRSSFATGSVQGPQFSGGFTPGVQTLSVFGLSPAYMKYLIDGRPIADYPALYNGTDLVTGLNGIPVELIDRVDVLVGGQSSIYGSDAVAGVVNVIMKKKLDGPIADARYGWTRGGGGTDRRFALADTVIFGDLNVTFGGQYERQDPIYGFQRTPTSTYFTQGTSPQTAERDFLLFGLFGDANGNTYYFEDPAKCGNVSKLFGGTTALHTRARRGDYCGTTNAGYYTIGNGLESTQGYLHLTDSLNEHVELFTDALASHELTRFNANGGGYFGTQGDSTSPFYYYEDPNIGDLLNVQHIFAPEEFGGMKSALSKSTLNSIRVSAGARGMVAGGWSYSADATYTENKLTEQVHMLFTSKINAFFAPAFGPSLGVDPDFGVNIFTPDYGALYQPLTPQQYASFAGVVNSYSRTEESLFRGQLTNTSLFQLPGGDAGFAAVVEGGRQGWDYAPDPLYATGETYLYTSTAGTGHRTRYAGTLELRLPVIQTLTATASSRYDAYKVPGGTIDKATYNLGLEFHPVDMLLLRGRYGTAFKAPTLADQFQGKSGFFQTLTDYYTCAINGFTGSTLGNCPQAQQSYFGETSGNPQLKPITAKVWDVGFVVKPLEHASLSFDYIHWDISNEVIQQSADQLLRTESACRLGGLDSNSGACQAAFAQVTRDATGTLVSISTPKINQSQEKLGAITMTADYLLQARHAGDFELTFSYSDLLKHDAQQYVTDPLVSIYSDPINYAREFKSKENVSLTWKLAGFSSTFYVEHYGGVANYLATINGIGAAGVSYLPSWTLANLSVGYEIASAFHVTFAVNNLFNKMPPVDHSYPGTENQPYDIFLYNVYGRAYSLEVGYKLQN